MERSMGMQDTIQTHQNHHEEVRWNDRNVARNQDENILTTVPSRVVPNRRHANEPGPEVYRQALRVMIETPEIESRLSTITAAMIVSVFGSWLGIKFTQSRAFVLSVDLVLFLASIGLAAFFIGVMLGEGFLPTGAMPVLLFGAAVIALLLMGIVLGNMIRSTVSKPQRRPGHAELKRAIIEHSQ
jgi:hypothetical protein